MALREWREFENDFDGYLLAGGILPAHSAVRQEPPQPERQRINKNTAQRIVEARFMPSPYSKSPMDAQA